MVEHKKEGMNTEKTRKIFAVILIALLGAFLAYALFRFVSAFFGGLILFILFKPLFRYFHDKKGLRKGLSAAIVIILSLIIIIVPLVILVNSLISETKAIVEDKEIFTGFVDFVGNLFPNSDIGQLLEGLYPEIISFSKTFIIGLSQSVGRFIISLIVTYFLFYYLLVKEEFIRNKVYEIIPFNEKNSSKFITEFKNITYSAVVATGIIAVLQGGLLIIAFLIFGIKGAILWGLIGTLLSFFPFFGTPVIWVPAVIIKFIQHRYGIATGLLISGLFISSIDNFIRPYIQSKIGNIHPLVSIIGIFMGVPIFGLLGVIIGPLLISYFILSVRMFKEEYY